MHVIVEIVVESTDRPKVGTPIRVEARDTTLQDVAAETIGSATCHVRGELGTWLETVELTLDRRPGDTTIWAHADVNQNGRVSAGDYVTMSNFPVPKHDNGRVTVVLRKV